MFKRKTLTFDQLNYNCYLGEKNKNRSWENRISIWKGRKNVKKIGKELRKMGKRKGGSKIGKKFTGKKGIKLNSKEKIKGCIEKTSKGRKEEEKEKEKAKKNKGNVKKNFLKGLD